MDFQKATANDWRFWPQREDVTLRVQTDIGVYASTALTAAGGAVKRRAITFKEMAASAGAYTNQDRAWLLPLANLPDGILPKPGDVIRDSGDVDWTIGDITVGKFGNTHKCIARALAIVNQLATLADVLRPVSGADAAGRPALASTDAIASGIVCRVQPEDSDMAEVFDRIANPSKFTAYLATPLAGVQAHDQFVADGTTYTILGVRNPARIWDLMSLSLELLP